MLSNFLVLKGVLWAKKKSEFEDTDLGNESYNFLTKTYIEYFKKCARKLREWENERDWRVGKGMNNV